MVSVEQLEALDLLLWDRSGNSASAHSLCNQSSISRRVRSALKAFDLKLGRSHEDRLNGDECLLRAQ